MTDEPPGTVALRLAAEFPPVPTAAWEDAIRHDLKGADYERRLVWRPEDRLAIQPYYRREHLHAIGPHVDAAPGAFPFLRAGTADWERLDRWAPPPGTIRADDWHDAGATTVQELGYAIAAGVDRLVAAIDDGLSPDAAVERVAFAFAVGSAYFLEIAKLRAARLLWAQACTACGVAPDRALLQMHVRTARANKSLYDPYTNLLRVTTEAMSAIIGGCQRLLVEPFAFDSHLAENVHHILREEARLDAVADPAGGSYYIEALTDAVAREAWAVFRAVEAEGGFGAAWRAGTIQLAIEESRLQTMRAVAARRRTLVGVNHYPNLMDRDPGVVPEPISGSDPPPVRLAEPFEEIRRRTAAYAARRGRLPAVLLLVRGDPKWRMARANFCLNFFGCGGFAILEGDSPEGRPADLIVLCSSDPEYLPLARDVCPRVSVPVLVAGRPVDQADALRDAGVQGFVHLGSDALDTLTEWQRRLGMA